MKKKYWRKLEECQNKQQLLIDLGKFSKLKMIFDSPHMLMIESRVHYLQCISIMITFIAEIFMINVKCQKKIEALLAWVINY